MNILCIFQKFDFDSSTIYLDLVTALSESGNKVYILAGTTKEVDASVVHDVNGMKVAYVLLPDQFNAGKIKKGMVQLLIEPKMIAAAKKHFWNESIDRIIYPTPPITLSNVVKKLKKHFKASTYLMLKDIFPQNAVDLKMMSIKNPAYKYFKWVERQLYAVSDRIGCMSLANIEYMRENSDEYIWDRLELFPNTVRIKPAVARKLSDGDIVNFVFGGNLGRPQAVDFLLEGMNALKDYKQAHFLIIGDGTESKKVEDFIKEKSLSNVEYHKSLPRDEYEKILENQDVGMIALHPDFTIPNFPSRLLSYMQISLPVLAVTDRNTDISDIVVNEAKCGFYTPSDDIEGFIATIKEICDNKSKLVSMGENGREYLEENYDVKSSVEILLR